MDLQIIEWLNQVSATVFRIAATVFVALNVAVGAIFLARRDRVLVQRWTTPWLGANLILLGAGIGVPVLALMAKLAVYAIASLGGMTVGGSVTVGE